MALYIQKHTAYPLTRLTYSPKGNWETEIQDRAIVDGLILKKKSSNSSKTTPHNTESHRMSPSELQTVKVVITNSQRIEPPPLLVSSSISTQPGRTPSLGFWD